MYSRVSWCIVMYWSYVSVMYRSCIDRIDLYRDVSKGSMYRRADTWPIHGDFFLVCIGLFLRVSLEGLFDTHRYMTLLGYIKIHQNTTKYSKIHFGGIHTLDLGEIEPRPARARPYPPTPLSRSYPPPLREPGSGGTPNSRTMVVVEQVVRTILDRSPTDGQ